MVTLLIRDILAARPHPNAWVEIVSQRDGTLDILLRHGALVIERAKVLPEEPDMQYALAAMLAQLRSGA